MEQPIDKDLTGLIVMKQFKLLKKLGSGAFGEIYLAANVHPTQKCQVKEVAIKIEKSDSKHPQLNFEAKLYNYLNQHMNIDKGVPKIFACTSEQGYNFLVIELLGKSLEDLFSQVNRRFSLQSVLLLALQMLESIEFLHSKQFIHRDIKPDNFLIGAATKSHKVYMVDFGLAKRYISKDGHITYKENKSLTGTARYASINTHLGIEQSRRDDLESLGYVLMYFLRGNLPWQNLRANNQKEKYERIMEKKLATSTEVLCKGYPEEFAEYMNYVKNLKFDEKPDYVQLKAWFKQLIVKNSFELKYIYDWDEIDEKKVSFSLDSRRQSTQEKEKEKEREKEKLNTLMIRQTSQPNKKDEQGLYSNIKVNNTNNSLLNQHLGSVQERLPSIQKQLNGQAALVLIQQLQQHQKQLQDRTNNNPKRLSKPTQQQQTQQSNLQVQNSHPLKTSSMHSIHQQDLPRARQTSMHQHHQQISQNSFYQTLYQIKPKSQEKPIRQTRNLKASSKFMISHKSSLPNN